MVVKAQQGWLLYDFTRFPEPNENNENSNVIAGHRSDRKDKLIYYNAIDYTFGIYSIQ